jgi:hypothetical protein
MYVNPIEILGLSDAADISSIDNEIVRKAKRKLFADIDLSDKGVFEYYGLELTKGNCEKAIDELTNNDYKEFYLYLANNKPLNEFLASGKETIFKNFKQDSIFKLPAFVKFISPYFAPKFDKVLLTAFENDNSDLTKAILITSILIAQTDLNTAFKSVSNNIQNKIAEIEEITKDIKNEESAYEEENIEDVVQLVKDHFPANTLNCLPQYFQSQISKIATSINRLSNSIWDAFDTTQVPNDLTGYLLTLNIGGLDRPTFEDNFKIINKKNNERIEQAKNAPLLKKWATVLLTIRDAIKKVEDKTRNSNEAYQNIKDLFDLGELNSLPTFADEIRTQIGYSIRSLSISIWNKQSDIKSALATINLALQINLDKEVKEKFKKDQTELSELEKKYRGVLVCHFCDKNIPDKKAGFTKKIYEENYRNTSGRTTSVRYRTAKVFIPRCKSCKKKHFLGLFIYYIIFLLIFCCLFWDVAYEDVSNDGYVFMLIIVISWIVNKLVITFYYRKQNIKNSSELILQKHPLLEDEIKYGWSFYRPSASTLLIILGLIGQGYDFVNKVTVNLIDKMYSKLNIN